MTIYGWIFYGVMRIFMSNDDYVRRFHGVHVNNPKRYTYDTTRHDKWGK